MRDEKERFATAKVKILGVSGSPTKGGNTALMVKEALQGARLVGGVETEFIDLAEKKIEPCKGCDACRRKRALRCLSIKDDMADIYPKLIEADGIIFGSPVYFGTVTAQLKAFMDRTNCLGSSVGYKLRYKVGGAVTVGSNRHGGQEYALSLILNYFLIMGGVVVGGKPPHAYWGSAGVSTYPGEIEKDEWLIREGKIRALETARTVGRRVAIVSKLIKSGVRTFVEANEILEF